MSYSLRREFVAWAIRARPQAKSKIISSSEFMVRCRDLLLHVRWLCRNGDAV
jgi:hypothetical protein